MNLLREYIRELLIEANSYGCNKHSLGYIDAEGRFIDIDKIPNVVSHEQYLDSKNMFDWEPVQNHWIKISTANEMSVPFIHKIPQKQLNGLVDMWLACKEYSKWIRSPETTYLNIYSFDFKQYEEITIPDFIEKHDTSGVLMDKFFKGLS